MHLFLCNSCAVVPLHAGVGWAPFRVHVVRKRLGVMAQALETGKGVAYASPMRANYYGSALKVDQMEGHSQGLLVKVRDTAPWDGRYGMAKGYLTRHMT